MKNCMTSKKSSWTSHFTLRYVRAKLRQNTSSKMSKIKNRLSRSCFILCVGKFTTFSLVDFGYNISSCEIVDMDSTAKT